MSATVALHVRYCGTQQVTVTGPYRNHADEVRRVRLHIPANFQLQTPSKSRETATFLCSQQ